MLIIHGSQLKMISETISNLMTDNIFILMNMTQVNYNQLLQPNIKSQIINKRKHKGLYTILICIDDVANDPDFTRKHKLLHQLYIRGWHYMISTITSTQNYTQMPPIVRNNIHICSFID